MVEFGIVDRILFYAWCSTSLLRIFHSMETLNVLAKGLEIWYDPPATEDSEGFRFKRANVATRGLH